MSHTPHELAEEFPDKHSLIHELKEDDPYFRKLFDEYHDVNRAIHRAETNVEPVAASAEEAMRKQRMRLKDQIAVLLR